MRVVIGEDSALFREGVAALLESAGHQVVGRAADGPAAVAQTLATRPDVVVLDVRMPPEHRDEGVHAARQIRAARPTQPVMLLSQHVEAKKSVDLVSQGAFGYLLKDRVLDVDDFLASLAQVAEGGSVLDPEVVRRLVDVAVARSRLETLTARETEVLTMMAEGRSNRAIAARLWLTGRTVETHVSSILTKLDLFATGDDNRRVLAVLAYLEATGATPSR